MLEVVPNVEVVQQRLTFLTSVIIGFFADLIIVDSYSYLRSDKYPIRHSDVVQLGSVTDDLLCLRNSAVCIQPYNGLRQQPASFIQIKYDRPLTVWRQQSRTRKLSYRKDNRAMRCMYGCPGNFRESLTTPKATFPEILMGFCSD